MVNFCSPAYKGFAKSPLLEAECHVCKWEILLFPFLICYQWSLVRTKQKKPQRIKSTENAALGHRSILQFLIVKFTARTQSVFVASPHHFLNSSPVTSERAGGHVGDKPMLCRARQRCSGGPGAGWMVNTYILLHWRSWVDFPRGLDKGGAGDQDSRRRKRCWELETEQTDSCPQKTEAVMPVSGACWRMSYLPFQELTLISTADLTKVGQLLPAQPWLLALQVI